MSGLDFYSEAIPDDIGCDMRVVENYRPDAFIIEFGETMEERVIVCDAA